MTSQIWIDGMIVLLAFAAGTGLGVMIGLWTGRRESEQQKQAAAGQVTEAVKGVFSDLSLQVLAKASEQLSALNRSQLEVERKLSSQELDHKKILIDHELKGMAQTLEGLGNLVRSIETERKTNFAELGEVLKATQGQMTHLAEATGSLREVLSSSQARGIWGERIADDILRLAGFLENVNYYKQKTIAGVGTKPDFTFLLPRSLVLNMDVKFPISNYTRFVQAASETERVNARRAFLSDVKQRIKEVTVRDYINPSQNTVDCVLMFIPHEQIYAFIQSEEPDLFESALKQKVVCCSPLTLFAVLAVMRQAVDSFALEKASGEMLQLISEFRKQWEKFTEKFDGLGQKIGSLQKEYEALATTRRRQLEKPMEKLEEIRISGVDHVSVPALGNPSSAQ
jgi:DNA recombination protein RmuC